MQRQGTLAHFLDAAPADASAVSTPTQRIPRACKQTPVAASPASADSKKKPQADASAAAAAAAAAASSSCDHGDTDDHVSAGDTFHCGVCEGRGMMMLCDGPCGRGFHADCMPECPDTGEGQRWECRECRDRTHECFICKQEGEDDKDVFLCSARVCGKFYHKECVALDRRSRVLDNGTFTCPRHRCASCKDVLSSKKKALKCLRCVNSYHIRRCMPCAGVYQFQDGDYMLCNTDMETLNATTDRSADDDEPLDIQMSVAEETGPAATTTTTAAAAAATSTRSVKAFNPFAIAAAVADEAAAPAAAAAAAGASPSAAMPAPASAAGSASTSVVRASQFFPKALWTPPTILQEFTMDGRLVVEGRNFVSSTPPYFKRVSANQYGEFVSKPTWKAEEEPCGCFEQKDKCTENCLNRAVYTECSRKCPNGAECRNQRISRREYAKTQVVLTEGRGWGLIAKEDLPEGALIIEYCGEMINDEECTRRLNETEITGKKDYYFFKLGNNLVIDAGPIGNNARFLNHSCSPNCKTEMWQIGAQQRVGIFTLGPVTKGTELTYDYNFEGFWQPGAALKCACGSANCAGTLGGKKKSKEEVESSGKKGGSKASAKAAASAAAKKGLETKRRKLEEAAAEAAKAAAAPAVTPKRRAPPVDRSIARMSEENRQQQHQHAGVDSAMSDVDEHKVHLHTLPTLDASNSAMIDDEDMEEQKESHSEAQQQHAQ